MNVMLWAHVMARRVFLVDGVEYVLAKQSGNTYCLNRCSDGKVVWADKEWFNERRISVPYAEPDIIYEATYWREGKKEVVQFYNQSFERIGKQLDLLVERGLKVERLERL